MTDLACAVERNIRAVKRQTIIWGMVVGLLTASIAVSVVELIDHPRQQTLAVVCGTDFKRCVVVSR